MLKLDVNNLTAAQSVRLDRAATLRLELNDIEERKLIGAPFDTVKYIAASEALERMLGGDPDAQQQPVDQFAGAREELLRFLENRAEKLERKAERTRAAALEASNTIAPTGAIEPPHHDQGAAPVQNESMLSFSSPPSPAVELLPEGTEPPKQPHVSYIDNAVIESDAARYQRVNGGTVTPPSPRPPSPATAAYFGNAPGGSLNLGGSPWRTRDWNPRRGW